VDHKQLKDKFLTRTENQLTCDPSSPTKNTLDSASPKSRPVSPEGILKAVPSDKKNSCVENSIPILSGKSSSVSYKLEVEKVEPPSSTASIISEEAVSSFSEMITIISSPDIPVGTTRSISSKSFGPQLTGQSSLDSSEIIAIDNEKKEPKIINTNTASETKRSSPSHFLVNIKLSRKSQLSGKVAIQ
jgi:hypothetical protein